MLTLQYFTEVTDILIFRNIIFKVFASPRYTAVVDKLLSEFIILTAAADFQILSLLKINTARREKAKYILYTLKQHSTLDTKTYIKM